MKRFIAAAIQMNSQGDKNQNLDMAEQYLLEAVDKQAKLVVFPECMDYCGLDYAGNAESTLESSLAFLRLSQIAREKRVWVHCGSIHEKSKDPKKPYNTSMLIGPDGELHTYYRKLHLFDVNIENGPHIKESSKVTPGSSPVVYDTSEIGTIGFSICYDIRFPELYRMLCLNGAEVLCIPASFAYETGKSHWEALLRARAIEEGCYVIAAGQIGQKAAMNTYGHSLIIDPWGRVLAEAGDESHVIVAEVDLDYVISARLQTGTIINRRKDIYALGQKND